MLNFKRCAPQVSVVLASLVLWTSFAWGLPTDAPAAEGEAEVAAEDPWAGVRISDAYDYAECFQCGKKNELRAKSCSRCAYELPQPSAEVTDPTWVFVPGKGYYREGTLLEVGNKRKGMLTAGLILIGSGLTTWGVALIMDARGYYESISTWALLGVVAGFGAASAGGVMFIVAVSTWKEPVYAFGSGERYGPYDAAYARRLPDTDGVALKVEVTVLGF